MTNKTRITLAAVIAVGMILFSYWVTNQRYAVSGETTLMRKIELVRGWFRPHINTMADSVLLVNVSYDQTLIGENDKYGVPAGYGQITDRSKLIALLTELKRKNDYKYIMLDVIFPRGTETDADSALFSLIASMERIVIPHDINGELADERLYSKAGLANYFTNYKYVSFAKFPYMVDGEKSMPLKMYEDMTGRHVTNHILFTEDNGRLARESIVLTFELRCDSAYTQDGQKTWYNLGMDLLGSKYVFGNDTIQGDSQLYTTPELTRDKYIIIGAFTGGDTHYSYLDNQAGSVIIFNAYLALLYGHHCLSAGVFLLLLVAFFILSYLILGRQTLDVVITGQKVKSRYLKAGQRALGVVTSWIGYSLFLTVLCVITYLWMGEVYDIFITATLFQVLSMLTNLIYKLKNKNKK